MRRIHIPIIALLFLVIGIGPAAAQDEATSSEQTIKLIEIQGNRAISTETIMSKIKTRAGQPYLPQAGRDDIRRLYETGYFSDIVLETASVDGGLKVIFKVEERPIIGSVEFVGAKKVSPRVLMSKIKTKEGQYLNLAYLKEDISALQQEYEKRGLSSVAVSHETETDPVTNKVKVTIRIAEGARQVIRRMYIDGNLHYPDSRIFGLIKTRHKRLIHAGFYKEDQLADDLERIKAFYLRNGYLDVRVDYRIDRDPKENIYLRIAIEEGQKYSVGRVVLKGMESFSDEDVRRSLKACLEGATFTYDALREDVANIQSFYYGKGYIFVQVKEVTSLDPSTGTVDISYDIVEDRIAYVERIDIRGNLKTRDKVIRRELRIKPGERFDGDKLKRSKERLFNLGYFEEVNYDTEPGSESQKRDLVVDVKEAKTGSISFGGGYSSIDQLVGFVEVEQKNFDWKNWKTFTGGGQDLKLRAELGSVRQTYELSFTEPWIFDKPYSFGFDVYKRQHDKEADVGYGYKEVRTGGDLRLGHAFDEYWKGQATYRLEEVRIEDVDATATADLRSEEGKNSISSLEFSLTRDTTDNVFNPTRGYVLSGSNEIAGGPMGGDKDFDKLFGLASHYFPVFGKAVLQLQARAGLAFPYNDEERVPIYERFYAGGANTIRGYEERSVGPVDPVTDDPLGGEALLVYNIELTFPLVEFIKGAVFVDAGNVWSDVSEIGDGGYKIGIGLGVRIKTPIGPLKLDYGFPMDEEPGKEKAKEGRFHFSMSHGF